MEAVLEALGDPDRNALRGLDRDDWYPFATLVRLDRAIARLTAPGDDAVYERLGAASGRQRTEWLGADARLYSVHGFLSRLAEEHAASTASARRATAGGDSRRRLSFSWDPEVHPSFCRASSAISAGRWSA